MFHIFQRNGLGGASIYILGSYQTDRPPMCRNNKKDLLIKMKIMAICFVKKKNEIDIMSYFIFKVKLLWPKGLFLFNEVFLDKQNIYPVTFMSEIIHSLYPPGNMICVKQPLLIH